MLRTMVGKAFQVEGTASEKILRQERDYHLEGQARSTVGGVA